ncbi:hypothetical protein EVAR_67419_1 [Eumeta japonica]|uniref:Uncharacterized protein n=1 Tax=Eumeta variegata TaxID=151549 RepID=A0A4C2A8Y3_EUMVA|nr:hypothetical protein EVAR_67419_1 [Eumeta japonica]
MTTHRFVAAPLPPLPLSPQPPYPGIRRVYITQVVHVPTAANKGGFSKDGGITSRPACGSENCLNFREKFKDSTGPREREEYKISVESPYYRI